jgi:type IV secretory pathway ATPase VirB11/archaellum biosynthesis ATPase
VEVRALNQPESWWGWHGYNHPQPLSITQIIGSGAVPPRLAAMLWLGMERGASIILAADPPGAGKTTILTALLAFAKPDAAVYFTRGWGETFRLPPPADEAPTYLLINEISDHLPVYSWGPYVQRAFELAADGYSLASTMHADTVDGVIEQLVEENDVPPRHIGHLAFVVPIYVGLQGGQRVRRISEVVVLEPLGDGFDRQSVARWVREVDELEMLCTPAEISAVARRLGMEDGEFLSELERRTGFLNDLVSTGIEEIDEVQRRVFEFGGYTTVV